MSLSITEQKIKGGHQVLMVRDGIRRLMAFPPTMRDLALQMCLEGNEVSETQYPELVAKFAKKREAQNKKTSLPPMVEEHIAAFYSPPAEPKAAAEPPAPWQIPDAGNENQSEKQVLADLLEAARQAEIALAEACETLHHARVDFKGAEDCAEAAWKAFNEALRSSLPEDSNVKGIVMSGGIIELPSNMAAST